MQYCNVPSCMHVINMNILSHLITNLTLGFINQFIKLLKVQESAGVTPISTWVTVAAAGRRAPSAGSGATSTMTPTATMR